MTLCRKCVLQAKNSKREPLGVLWKKLQEAGGPD